MKKNGEANNNHVLNRLLSLDNNLSDDFYSENFNNIPLVDELSDVKQKQQSTARIIKFAVFLLLLNIILTISSSYCQFVYFKAKNDHLEALINSAQKDELELIAEKLIADDEYISRIDLNNLKRLKRNLLKTSRNQSDEYYKIFTENSNDLDFLNNETSYDKSFSEYQVN